MAKCLDLITLEREAEESQDQACIFSDLKNPKALESKGICVQKLQVKLSVGHGWFSQSIKL